MTKPAQAAWAHALATWGIPDAILQQAPQSPWIHPVEQFVVDTTAPKRNTPAEQRALEALPEGGSVLDVGCGGGKAAFALVPPAGNAIGVDHQAGMLLNFAQLADALGVQHTEVLGDWPGVADQTPPADVVTCHHVLYNVSDLGPFITSLSDHAKNRVVVEIPWQHPLLGMASAWQTFWNLDRPEGPTAHDAHDVIRELGFDAHIERFNAPYDGAEIPFDVQVEYLRIRLCLSPNRDADLADFLRDNPPKKERDLAVIWWDPANQGEL